MRKNISRGILFILTMMVLMGCSKEKMELKSKSLIVEYGNTISNKAEDYLKNDADFLKNIKVENLPKNEKDKEYPSVGEYEIILKNDNQEEVVKVSVKDTVAPEFKDLKEKYEIEYGSKIDLKQFSATDLSKTEITLDDSKVNYKKRGTYKATVIAEDSSENKTTKEVDVVIKEEKKEVTKKESNNGSSSKNNGKSNNTSGNGSRLTQAKAEAKKIVNQIAPNGMADYDKAKAICKYLFNNVSVQTDQSNEAYKKNHGDEAYGALILKKAACSGFCNAVTLMCQEAGIQTQHINKNKWTHQWNKVKVQGKWVILDAQGGMFGMSKHPLQEANETQQVVRFTDVNGQNSFVSPNY